MVGSMNMPQKLLARLEFSDCVLQQRFIINSREIPPFAPLASDLANCFQHHRSIFKRFFQRARI